MVKKSKFILFFLLLVGRVCVGFSQKAETIEYRNDGSVLSSSGVEKDGSHYTKVYDNHGNVIARFISGDNTYKRGQIIFYGEDENMEYPYFDYSNVLADTTFYRALGYTSRMKYYFMYDSAEYVIRLRLFENGKPACKSYRDYGDKIWTNYYYDKSGRYLGTGTTDGYYKPLDGMNIRYYGLFEAGPQPAVPFGVYQSSKGMIQSAVFFNSLGEELGKCDYKNGSPFNGLVLEADFIWTYFTQKKYKEGLVTGDITEYDYHFKVLNVYAKDKTPMGNRTTSSTTPKNSYKDGQPYSGVFNIEYSVVEMWEGKRNGITKSYDFLTRDTLSIETYKDGIKQGYAAFTPIPGRIMAEGYYKDDLPFEGDFVLRRTNDFVNVSSYKKGEIARVTTYIPKTKGNKYLDFQYFSTCVYKGGMPYEGLLYDDKKYDFRTYKSGLLNGISYYLLSGRDTTQLTTYVDGKRHGLSFQRDGTTGQRVTGYYKNDVKFEGQFQNEKNQRQIFEYKNGVPVKVIENNSYIISYFGLINEKREGLCVQQQRFGPKNKWEIIYKNDQPFDGPLVVENKIISYQAGQQTGQLWEYETADLMRLNAKYTLKNGVKNGKAIIYHVYEKGDSIQLDYQEGEVQNGILVTTDQSTRIKKIFTIKNGKATSDSTYLYPNYEGKPKEYLHFKNGKKREGIEYLYKPIAIINRYKNYLLVESDGKYDEDYGFSTKCSGLKCRFEDQHHKLVANYLYDTLNHSLSLITKDVTGDSLRAKIINDTLAAGSILFYNYKSAKRNDHFIWDKAIVTPDKTGTSITLINEKYDFYPIYTTSEKMAVPFPFYDANLLIIKLLNSEQIFKVSYKDRATNQLYGSHTAEGWNIKDGLTLEQSGNEITARMYRDNAVEKEEVISSARIAEWVKVNTLKKK